MLANASLDLFDWGDCLADGGNERSLNSFEHQCAGVSTCVRQGLGNLLDLGAGVRSQGGIAGCATGIQTQAA